jgi:Subunit ChlI of Mg-chelatase
MFARVTTVAFEGIEARPIDVQVQIGPGMPAFTIVGLPDKAVAESRERVRGALNAIGLALAKAHHRQSRSCRSAEGREPLRPPHRARAYGGDRRRGA